ncbi:MAG: putative 7-carboxy-7-deazaguanine synthase QueE [Lachnospiraceae bacterium]|nr:putative 7-carboxy-7-deazaguanine synthase QueE [Lachnospiraceae bacterium]
MAKYKVAELFESVNGEGPRSGQLAVFVRMQGCNLACSYCDTKWANEKDAVFQWMSTEEITDEIRRLRIRNVTLTGGEPLMQEDIEELLIALTKDPWLRVEVETNGSIKLESFAGIADTISFNMDYKLPGSGMEHRMLPKNLDVLTAKDTVKFVVQDQTDLAFCLSLIADHDLTERCRVFLSPVYGGIEPEEIVEFMKEHCLNDVTLQLQIHKIIWDSETRGV